MMRRLSRLLRTPESREQRKQMPIAAQSAQVPSLPLATPSNSPTKEI